MGARTRWYRLRRRPGGEAARSCSPMNETVRLGRGAASSRSSDTEAYAVVVVVVVDVDVGGDDDDGDGAFVMVDDDEQESTSLQTILMLGLPWAAILFRWKGGERYWV